MDAEMRSHLRICLPPDQLHGPARLQAMRAAQSRSVDIGIAVAGFLLRLRAARDRANAETGLEAAVAALSELRPRHRHAALWQDRRRRDAIFVTRGARPSRRLMRGFAYTPRHANRSTCPTVNAGLTGAAYASVAGGY